MNANTACKIREAVDQAIECGESKEAILVTVKEAIKKAQIRRYSKLLDEAVAS